MANANYHRQQYPTLLERLQARRGALADTISRLERELHQAEADLDRANHAAEAARHAEISRLQEQQAGYQWAALGAAYAHQDQTWRLIRRRKRHPFLRIAMVVLLLVGLGISTKSVLVLGLGVLVVFFLWRVLFNRHLILSRRMDMRDLRRRLEQEPPSARTLRREAERASDEARRLTRSDPETREQRTYRWHVQTLKNSLRANRARLRELDEELALYTSGTSHP